MKYIVALVTVFILLLYVPTVHAEKESGTSARLVSQRNNENELLLKRLVVREFFQTYSSPLTDMSDAFVTISSQYELDPYLLPSISGVESTFGKFLMPNSYNPFGWGGGYIYFESWEDGIDTVASGLRNNYLNRGAESIQDIGNIYSTGAHWPNTVTHFMNQLETIEQEKRLYFSHLSVEL